MITRVNLTEVFYQLRQMLSGLRLYECILGLSI